MASAGKKQAANIAAFDRQEVVEEYSSSKLNVAEQDLFQRFYRHGESLLDLACGAGRTTVRTAEMGLTVKGIDTSKTLIAAAQKQYPTLDFEVGSYFQTHLPGASYDHVLISANSLDYAHPEHNRVTAIQECHRVLKPGGTFIFSSHNIKWLHGALWRMHRGSLGLKLWRMATAFKNHDYVYEDSMGTYTFFGTPRYVIRQVKKQGFSLEEIIGLPRFWGTQSYSCTRAEPGINLWAAAVWSQTFPISYRCGHVYYVFRKL